MGYLIKEAIHFEVTKTQAFPFLQIYPYETGCQSYQIIVS